MGTPLFVTCCNHYTPACHKKQELFCRIPPRRGKNTGGGVAGGFDLFGGRLGEAFRSHCLKPSAAAEIRACSLGNEAGMYGAAYSALQVAQDA